MPGASRARGLVPDRRSSDPINALGRRLGAVTTSALDPNEIAAAIEARGVNDEMARREYDCDDVFALASAIYHRAPLHPTRSRVRLERDPVGRRRILRGLLFALPGVLFFPLARLTDIESAAAVFVCVTLLGWVASQGVSSLAHLQGARVGLPAMRAVLRAALIGGAVGAVGLGIGAAAMGIDQTLVLAADAQMVYLLAAIVLLTLDRDRELGAVLVPFTLLVVLLSLIPGVARWVTASVVVAAAAALGIVAFRETRSSRWARLNLADVRRSFVMATYGLLLGLLIASPIVVLLLKDAPVTLWLGAAALPITLSMGIAERRFVEFRIDNRESLQRDQNPSGYSRRAMRRFLRALGGYVAALVVLSALFVGLGSTISPPDRTAFVVIVAYVVLGAGMFGALVVANSGGAHRLVVVLAAALVVDTAAGGGAEVFLVVAAVVAVAFIWLGATTSRRVTAAR